MSINERPPSALFLSRTGDFLALQACFSRQFNLLPSHWLALHSALSSVHYQQGQWICAEFSTAEIARDSLTSRETVRRSMHWLLAKGLVLRMKRRYVISPLTLSVMRDLLDKPAPASAACCTRPSEASPPHANGHAPHAMMLSGDLS